MMGQFPTERAHFEMIFAVCGKQFLLQLTPLGSRQEKTCASLRNTMDDPGPTSLKFLNISYETLKKTDVYLNLNFGKSLESARVLHRQSNKYT